MTRVSIIRLGGLLTYVYIYIYIYIYIYNLFIDATNGICMDIPIKREIIRYYCISNYRVRYRILEASKILLSKIPNIIY